MAEPSTRLQTTFGETPQTESGRSFREAMGLREPYIQQTARARQDLVKAEGDVLQAQQRQLEQKAAGETLAKMQYAQDESAAQEAYKEAKAAEPIPAFVPTRDNAEDLAKLFSFIGVMGTFLGRGGGKQAAMGAMAGMTGMMEGWRQGRMDLYNQEKVKFEKDFARVNKIHQDLAKDLENALRTAATNKEVGLSMANEAAVKAGSDIVRQTIATKGIAASVELAKEISASAEKVIADVNKREAEDRRNKALVAAARERAAGVGARAGTAGWKLYQTSSGKIIRYNASTDEIEGGSREDLVNATVVGTAKKSGGAANDRYAFNINESFSQAATDLLNVSQMPGNTVLGAFAGMTGESPGTITGALKAVFARKVTPEDARLMQQIVAGLDQNMARALGGGYATSTSRGLIQAYKEQVAQYGDSPLAQAMFLSRMKQELEILAKAFKNHPGANEGYVADMKDYVDSLNRAIPFNVSDVIDASRGAKETVTQKFSDLAKAPTRMRLPAETAPTAPAPSKPTAPVQVSPSAPAPASAWTEADEKRLRELEEKVRGAK